MFYTSATMQKKVSIDIPLHHQIHQYPKTLHESQIQTNTYSHKENHSMY